MSKSYQLGFEIPMGDNSLRPMVDFLTANGFQASYVRDSDNFSCVLTTTPPLEKDKVVFETVKSNPHLVSFDYKS